MIEWNYYSKLYYYSYTYVRYQGYPNDKVLIIAKKSIILNLVFILVQYTTNEELWKVFKIRKATFKNIRVPIQSEF